MRHAARAAPQLLQACHAMYDEEVTAAATTTILQSSFSPLRLNLTPRKEGARARPYNRSTPLLYYLLLPRDVYVYLHASLRHSCI